MKQKISLIVLVMSLFLAHPLRVLAAPTITNISDNKQSYASSQIPTYKKYEVTFSVGNSVAKNTFYPYETSVPAGIEPGTGITVNAQFLAPGESDWNKAFTTPAFYYEDFDYALKGSGQYQEWMYPNNKFFWKVRFAPNREGIWQYRLTAQDASGTVTSNIQTFTVVKGTSHGFIKVSSKDTRYFEFDDGTYFPGVGINLNFSDIAWVNPVMGNKNLFAQLKQKGIQLVRMWQSQWAIYGSFWNPWHYLGDNHDYTWLRQTEKFPGSDFSIGIKKGQNDCVSFGNWTTYAPAVKPNTTYRIRVRVKTTDMGNAQDSSKPYGLVVKTGGWLDNCGQSGAGTVQSSYLSSNSDWTTLTGSFKSGSNQNYLDYLYIALENINAGSAYVDSVWMEEDLGGGQYGANIISKPSMDHLKYIDQRNAYSFDKMLELAEQNDIYLKVLSLEKKDVETNMTKFDGTTDSNEDNNGRFYGDFYGPAKDNTKIHWLQKAWWRYEQARWGYSTNIHSWELLNEGDPGNGNHWQLTDEMAKTMKCRVFGISVAVGESQKCNSNHPNSHLTTTSFWGQFPTDFWGSTKWPNVDYADVHAYISTSYAPIDLRNLMKYDAALYHEWHSNDAISRKLGKPVMRGEAGLDEVNAQDDKILGISRDTQKTWIHNYMWANLYHGGLIEEYWWWKEHMTDSSGNVDPQNTFIKYLTFIQNIPLNNGKYHDAEAVVGNSLLRAWGQKDLTNNRAHLWIQNSKHTWKNVVDGVSIAPITTTVSIPGFAAGTSLKVEWWDTYSGNVSKTENLTVGSDGKLTLQVSNLTTDTAVKIGDYTNVATPSTSPTKVPGDTNNSGHVDIFDYNDVMTDFGTTNPRSNFDGIGVVDIYDYNILITNFGR